MTKEDIYKYIMNNAKETILISFDCNYVKKGFAHASFGLNYHELGRNIYYLIMDENDNRFSNNSSLVCINIKAFKRIHLNKIYQRNEKIVKFLGE